MRETMKRGLWIAWVTAILSLADGGDAASAQEFLSGHEDLPLLAGLVQDRDSVTVFDSPQGRVIETYAQTPESSAAVLDAYAAALPQLGWKRKSSSTFVRDGERLTFDVVSKAGPTVVRILITAD